jgi:hypothetical protein
MSFFAETAEIIEFKLAFSLQLICQNINGKKIMVSQIVAAADQSFMIEPANRMATNAVSGKSEDFVRKEFKLFGADGFTFRDFIDMINPLQHIPVVGTIYRAITGDELDPGSKMFGGTVLGGPIGAVASIIDVVIKHNTGKDVGEHTMAMFSGTGVGDTPVDFNDLPTDVAAAPIPGQDPARIAAPAASGFGAAPAAASQTPGKDFAAAGMSAMPNISPEKAAGILDRLAKYTPGTAPDLQALAHFNTAADAPGTALAAAPNKPLNLEPLYAIDDKPAAAPKPAPVRAMAPIALTPAVAEFARNLRPASASQQLAAVQQVLTDGKQDWLTQNMMQALDKYESGRSLGNLPPAPGNSVLR